MRLADRQRDFAAALLDPALPAPSGLVGPDGEPSPRRFAVYRNNVIAGLVNTLKQAFPAVCKIVGSDFFEAMGRGFVRAEPPTSPVLLDYGAGFAAFITQFAPAASLPWLPGVARIERAWIEAYHAQEAVPLAAEAFMAIDVGQLAGIRLQLHPSTRIIRSPTPALTIWRMNVDGGVPAPVDVAAGGEDAFVIRPLAQVHVRLIPPGGAEFVLALAAGKSVTQALQSAMAGARGFDLSACLAGLIDAQAFVGYSFDAEASARGCHA